MPNNRGTTKVCARCSAAISASNATIQLATPALERGRTRCSGDSSSIARGAEFGGDSVNSPPSFWGDNFSEGAFTIVFDGYSSLEGTPRLAISKRRGSLRKIVLFVFPCKQKARRSGLERDGFLQLMNSCS
jgi:hypothetical protein